MTKYGWLDSKRFFIPCKHAILYKLELVLPLRYFVLTLLTSYRRVLYNSHILYYIRIFIALTGATLVPWLLGQDPKVTIPLTLGVVAAALTDLDDRLTGRIKNLIITLFCFFVASVSIELLFPYPLFFFLFRFFDLWVHLTWCFRATLCHHCIWRLTDSHLYHARCTHF